MEADKPAGAWKDVPSFSEMLSEMNTQGREMEVIILMADSGTALEGIASFMELLTIPVRVSLIGEPARIEEEMRNNQLGRVFTPENTALVKAETLEEAFSRLFSILDPKKNQFIMKGNLSTDKLMRGLLQRKERLLMKGRIVSHIRLFESPRGISLMSDGGFNVLANVEDPEKRDRQFKKVISNTERAAHLLGLDISDIFFPGRSSGTEELRNLARFFFAGPNTFPRAIQFPWVGPANVVYKAVSGTPWVPLHRGDLEELAGEKSGFLSGLCSVFTKEHGSGSSEQPLMLAAPGMGAGFKEKRNLLRWVIEEAGKIGMDQPKVALLDFTEQYPRFMDVPSIADARKLVEEFGDAPMSHAIVDGPMAFDLAVCPGAAEAKQYDSPVAGKADILFLPDYISGVLLSELYKHWEVLRLPWKAGDITFGTSVPLIVASRSDSAEHKLRTTITAAFLATRLREGKE